MKMKVLARTAAPAVGVFSLTFLGVLALAPKDSTNDDSLVPVVVATRTLADGTESTTVRGAAEVRMVPDVARSEGALASLDELPIGVLAFDHVPGQQILATSFARNRVESLGADFVAVSVTLDPQRWVGPWLQAGRIVDVYDTREPGPILAAERAVILDAPQDPAAEDLEPTQDKVISLGVPKDALTEVLAAAENGTVWLVGH
jgi:hypothetical protein